MPVPNPLEFPIDIWTSTGVRVTIEADRVLQLRGASGAVADVVRCLGDAVGESPPEAPTPLAVWGGATAGPSGNLFG